MRAKLFAVLLACILVLGGYLLFGQSGSSETRTVRIGYFPTVLHSQAIVGMAREDFARALGPETDIKALTFNAGPAEMEALFANEVDIAYVGPSPAVNAYLRSKGQTLRVVAGAASGGAAFIVRNDSGITHPPDLAGKRIASPQLGNTQDVALRSYLQSKGLAIGEGVGQIHVIPTDNTNILLLFQKKELDGAWLPEPWATRLLQEGQGRIFVDERDLWENGTFSSAVVVVRQQFLEEHPDLVRRFLVAHVQVTGWINAHPADARIIVRSEIRRLTHQDLSSAVLEGAFSRFQPTYQPFPLSIQSSTQRAYQLGFLGPQVPAIDGIYDLSLLKEVLKQNGTS